MLAWDWAFSAECEHCVSRGLAMHMAHEREGGTSREDATRTSLEALADGSRLYHDGRHLACGFARPSASSDRFARADPERCLGC